MPPWKHVPPGTIGRMNQSHPGPGLGRRRNMSLLPLIRRHASGYYVVEYAERDLVLCQPQPQ